MPQVVFRQVATATSASASQLTVSKPAGTTQGDGMLAGVVHNNSSGAVTAPAGWTSLERTSTNNATIETFEKIAGGSEPADYTFSWTNGAGCAAIVVTYQSSHTSDLVNGDASATATNDSPSVTGNRLGRLVVFVVDYGISGTPSVTPPGSMTERSEVSPNGQTAFAVADEALTVDGSTGTRTFTFGQGQQRHLHSIAVRPDKAGRWGWVYL